MNVSLKTFMPVAAAGLLGLSACSDVKERAKDYMQDRPYSEYAELTNTKITPLYNQDLIQWHTEIFLTVQNLQKILLL